jgi:ceramide glucosyltransferase
MIWLATIFAALALLGLAQAMAGWALVRRFAAQPRPEPVRPPPVSVLKPLHGDEPLLEDALASLCAQNYPAFQIVFGVRDADDPALAVVARLRARYPDQDIAVVVDATPHGKNRKIENLINMLSVARHDVLVIADSDVHADTRYLRQLVAALDVPGVGLVTTLYVGLPARRRLPALLGTGGITHFFLPGALLARAMGRQDCLGATMALRRETLARIGGLEALVDHLADDNRLGQLVRAQGLHVALAPTLPATTVGEDSLPALFRHELRWARTIRALEPAGFAASVLQYKLVWAALSVLAAPGFPTLVLFALVWLGGALAARGIEFSLAPLLKGLAFTTPVWLLPLRELFSVAVMAASYAGDQVEWRGHYLSAKRAMREKTGLRPS